MLTVCLHGAESTGKSTLATALHHRFGWSVVAEYGREWAETHGTDFTMDALLAIARGQDAAMRAAAAAAVPHAPPVLLLDTDPLMTAAWAQMLHGHVPAELLAYAKADFYLLFAPDTPWVADGTRFFGTAHARAQFAQTCTQMLELAGVPWQPVSGTWQEREETAVAAIERMRDEL